MKPFRCLLGVVLSAASGTSIDAAMRLPDEGRMPEFRGATEWINSPPLSPEGLRGKVVLVDFWTYTCINWLRSYPYVRAWAAKYKDQGLVVVGVHTPEFGFEKNVENVRWATMDRKIDFPVVVDNDYAIWRAFENNSWPAIYIIDAHGRIRHHQLGEGQYEQTEQVIQQLLTEAGSVGLRRELIPSIEPIGSEAAADWANLRSPENYLGSLRTENFSSTGWGIGSKRRVYSAPDRLRLNHWALVGDWTVGPEAIMLHQPNGRIKYRFHARDLHIVMGAAERGNSVRFRILIDGKPPGIAHGSDVDEQGNGVISRPRLYQLIRQVEGVRERDFEIEFLDPGVEAFSFTFG